MQKLTVESQLSSFDVVLLGLRGPGREKEGERKPSARTQLSTRPNTRPRQSAPPEPDNQNK